ncbi:hypothetical protein LAZ67_10001665 [Cordylochernes scorpioides]|uniref:ATP-dependent DNA helicase n=1 Tax=Cordylochernes scorpioides TaxID=51811 RepID=A0ABY6KZD1_9ARAC|nr:hypothetical protein LAZ67_10001665 [Cordylochernes scorpioides]
MPAPNRKMNDAFISELKRERKYDHHKLDLVVQTNVPLLNPQQKEVYNTLMKEIDDGNGDLYFLEAPGGTDIAVAVAYSVIAAILLEGCRTAHSALKLPLNLQNIEAPTYFSEQLLIIGNGRVPFDESSGLISFPQNFCNLVSLKDELINKVFPSIITNYKNSEWLSKRAILAAKKKDVDDLDTINQNEIIGTMHSFKSIDCVTNADEATNYPIEFLNSLDVPGHLKIDA